MPTTITVGNDLSSDKVPEIMRAIDEVVFQTNIMALHAAVGRAEAVDAGSSKQPQGMEPGGNG